MLDWDDLKVFLSVARSGSTLGAARALGLNQTTVGRRVQALEHALGLTLFQRRTTGYALSEHGKALLGAAERMEAAAAALTQDAERLRRLVSGVLRITAPESMFAHLLSAMVVAFRKEHPGVQIQQISSEDRMDLEGGEVDIAFRAAETPLQESLIAQRLPNLGWTVYSGAPYRADWGHPSCPADLPAHEIVVFDGPLGATARARWFLAHADPNRIVARSNTVPNMRGLLAAGIGVGLLPCIDGDNTPGLVRCFEPIEALEAPWWIVMTPEVHRIPLARRFADFAAARMRLHRRELRGARPDPAGPGVDQGGYP